MVVWAPTDAAPDDLAVAIQLRARNYLLLHHMLKLIIDPYRFRFNEWFIRGHLVAMGLMRETYLVRIISAPVILSCHALRPILERLTNEVFSFLYTAFLLWRHGTQLSQFGC